MQAVQKQCCLFANKRILIQHQLFSSYKSDCYVIVFFN